MAKTTQTQVEKDTAKTSAKGNKGTGLPNDASDESKYKKLVEQVQAEYKLGWQHIEPKLQVWRRRLKLMNNQRRDEAAVGDVTMFTQFQTVLAALYDDQLMVEFKGRNEGDEDVAENLNTLALKDADVMRKAEFDYFWMWNTIFFGHSVVYFTTFSREKDNTPIPELANMLTFLRDPKAVSINGDTMGHNACRFFGREIQLTKDQMKSNPDYFDVDQLKPGVVQADSITEQAKRSLEDAQGLTIGTQAEEETMGENGMYDLLEWCTHWRDPSDNKVKKVLVVLGNGRSKVCRLKIFLEDKKPAKEWPVGDRMMYPHSNDWDGTSLPDLVEDKQRMRAVLNNLAIKMIKADLYPSYLYARKRFGNRADFNLDQNKFIPLEGDGDVRTAVTPMQRATMNLTLYDQIMQSLSLSAQQATATPDMQQGRLNEQNRSATEIVQVQQGVGTRYSLTAKVFGWSEKWFWQRWYRLYKDNFKKGLDEKILRLEGAFGPRFRPLDREDIIAEVDPDISIESRVMADAKANQRKQDFFAFMSIVAQYPGTNLRYALKRMGRMIGLYKDELDRLFPPIVDELLAEDENVLLSKDKVVFVNANDNHEVHLEIHKKAGDTKQAFNHIEAHKKALELKRDNPGLFPQQQQPGQPGQQAPSALTPIQAQPVMPNPIQPMIQANEPKASYMK